MVGKFSVTIPKFGDIFNNWFKEEFGDILNTVREFEEKVKETEDKLIQNNSVTNRENLHEITCRNLSSIGSKKRILTTNSSIL